MIPRLGSRLGFSSGHTIACLSPEAADVISAGMPSHLTPCRSRSRSRFLVPGSSLMSTFVLAVACSVVALFAISANSVTPAPTNQQPPPTAHCHFYVLLLLHDRGNCKSGTPAPSASSTDLVSPFPAAAAAMAH